MSEVRSGSSDKPTRATALEIAQLVVAALKCAVMAFALYTVLFRL